MSESDNHQAAVQEAQVATGSAAQKRSCLLVWLRRLLLTGLALCVLFVGFVWYANHAATRAGKGILFDDVNDVPKQRAGLVFGCSEKLGSRENLHFKYRIEAAVELWRAGKVDKLIVSGLEEPYYDEPTTMAQALIAAGVPKDKIWGDGKGVRTLDSVLRAKRIPGLDSLIVVSQRYQNERAAYIAKAHGIKVYGYNARDVEGYTARREILARVKMWMDINITHKKPIHPGKPEPLIKPDGEQGD